VTACPDRHQPDPPPATDRLTDAITRSCHTLAEGALALALAVAEHGDEIPTLDLAVTLLALNNLTDALADVYDRLQAVDDPEATDAAPDAPEANGATRAGEREALRAAARSAMGIDDEDALSGGGFVGAIGAGGGL
jgi:hypothetical protein